MSQPDFSHLERLNVASGVTAAHTFYGIRGEPKLTCRPTSEANKAYLNATLLRSRRLSRRMRAGKMTAEMLKDLREQDRELYPLHVVVAWEGIKDSKGENVPFSPEACSAFLRAIPDDMFDELRNFCGLADNFRPEDESDSDDEDVRKN